MRICLIGEYSGEPDEAMRKISQNLAEHLSREHAVYRLDLLNLSAKKVVFDVKRFDPDVIHYIHGPTFMSFVLLKFLSIRCPRAKTVLSAMHPDMFRMPRWLVRMLRPKVVLTQSDETDRIFRKLGLRTHFYVCGVDTERFRPPAAGEKEWLRKKYAIPLDKYVILHVGSIKPGRNVEMLAELSGADHHLLIVGAVSVGRSAELEKLLREKGADIRTEYLKRIEELYRAADCYVYPVLYRRDPSGKVLADSIELPLTVVEAMACGLPVVSTRFGALPRVFSEGEGLLYAETVDDFVSALNKIKGGIPTNTRKKALLLSWEASASNLEEIYRAI